MRIESRPLCVALAITAALILLVGDLLMYLSGVTGSSVIAKLAEYFWADQEANLWSWYSSLLLSSIGIGLGVLALRQRDRLAMQAHLVLGAAAVLMSADEVASLHEALGYLGDATDGLTSHWLLLGVPMALVAGLIALRTARRIDPRLRRRLVVAGAVYLAGAVGLEFFGGGLSGPMGLPRADPLYILEVTLEEGLEFSGSLLALSAVLQAISPRTKRAEMRSAISAPIGI